MVRFELDIDDCTESSLSRFLAKARRAVGLRGRVNVLLTSDDQMRELNRRFRRKDKATDVLSFPAPEQLRNELAGDIAISSDIARRNARELGHAPATELKVLVLHGLLHLAGYDHETDNGEMARVEAGLRRELTLPESLIERVEGGAAAHQEAGPSTTPRSAAPLGMTRRRRRAGPSTTPRSAAPLGMTGRGNRKPKGPGELGRRA